MIIFQKYNSGDILYYCQHNIWSNNDQKQQLNYFTNYIDCVAHNNE